eukprot:9438058-Pyramimonas_sp.AAC.1
MRRDRRRRRLHGARASDRAQQELAMVVLSLFGVSRAWNYLRTRVRSVEYCWVVIPPIGKRFQGYPA